MNFDLWQLFAVGVAYLLLLFFIAYAAERGWLPRRLARHPLTYTLSLGVYATSWSFYGSVGFAQNQGYNFLTIYLGVTLAFLLTPVLLRPILRLTREYQLASLADVFAFRYQSQLAGVLVTLFMLAGVMPYIALQIRAVTESLQVLTQESTPGVLALGFCVTLTLFAVLFGARHISVRERHEGLVVAIAFESLVKLAALLAVGLFAVYGVFGGIGGLDRWVAQHPEALQAIYQPVREGPWSTLLLLAFAAAFLLPRQFHMAFTENLEPRALTVASWAFPLFLLLLTLAIPPIPWAGVELAPRTVPDYYVLGITLHSGSVLLPVLTFIGGLSAASAMTIVTTLALAAMCMNHLVLPASFPPRLRPETNIYRLLLWGRRALIAVIISAGYGFYLLLEHNQGLVQLGLISFVAVAQFLPGIIGLLFWRRANRFGFITGLCGGATVWAATLLLPLLQQSGILPSGWGWMVVEHGGGQPWRDATLWSLSINAFLFTTGSLLVRATAAEQEAAVACCRDSAPPAPGILTAVSPAQFKEQLARITGAEMAETEVRQALDDLGMDPTEYRQSELRRLRDRIERNLSGLVGPLLARMIVDDRLRLDPTSRSALAASMRFIEQRLADSRTQLKGLAAELDGLRRYHRQVLHDLPLGVSSLGPELEVISWNQAMTEISGIAGADAVGGSLADLPEPWSGMLSGFLRGREKRLRKVMVRIDGRTRVFNLHKAAIESLATASPDRVDGTVILVEDLTDLYLLETELTHSERLASVGRLAAGVAHEVGNPVTGIACLTQNMLMEAHTREDEESLRQILEQTKRVSAIVQSLVTFSHSGTAADHAPEPLTIADCVDEAIRLVSLSHAGKQMACANRCDPEHIAFGDRQRMVQVFVNLLSNACDASQPGSRVEVASRIDYDHLEVEVTDEGSGIKDEHLDRVFEPFFTTKEPGQGTGLGLPMVYNIVQELAGSVSIHRRADRGIRVCVRLPLTLDQLMKSRMAAQVEAG